MKITVKVSKNFRSLADELPVPTRDDMRELGLGAIEAILRRTRAGIDQDGKAFAPYSPRYAEVRASVGKPGRVNLELSGSMLGDLRVTDVDDTSVTIGY